MKRKSNQSKPARKSRSGSDFPLSRHPRGYWCKRYKRPDGKWAMAYFGKLVTNAFLNAKQMAMEAGEIGARTMAEYIATGERLARVFGSGRAVEDLTAAYAWEARLLERPVRFGPTFKKPSKRVLRGDGRNVHRECLKLTRSKPS